MPVSRRGKPMPIADSVTVIGGGVGGLAAALACARHGAAVTVLEQADEIGDAGAGVQISPNGWRVLRALGVADALSATSPRARAVRLRDFRRGADVCAVPLDDPEMPYHFVHRADLAKVLSRAATEAGVRIRLGARVTGVAMDGGDTRLEIAGGTAVSCRGPTIAADGLHSAARRALNPKSRPYFTGQAAWRCVVPAPPDTAPEAHVFLGPGRHLVAYPLRDGAWMNIVAVEERDGWAAEGWRHEDDPRHLRRAFADFCPEVRALLADVGTVHLWGLFRHPVAGRWVQDSLVLLGDAAHPTLPFMAQGANMALEDAFVLARCLAEADDTPAGLARYQAARRPRTARIVQAAEDNARHYHIPPGPYRWAAHSALRLAARFAPHLVHRRYDWIYRFDATAVRSR